MERYVKGSDTHCLSSAVDFYLLDKRSVAARSGTRVDPDLAIVDPDLVYVVPDLHGLFSK